MSENEIIVFEYKKNMDEALKVVRKVPLRRCSQIYIYIYIYKAISSLSFVLEITYVIPFSTFTTSTSVCGRKSMVS